MAIISSLNFHQWIFQLDWQDAHEGQGQMVYEYNHSGHETYEKPTYDKPSYEKPSPYQPPKKQKPIYRKRPYKNIL